MAGWGKLFAPSATQGDARQPSSSDGEVWLDTCCGSSELGGGAGSPARAVSTRSSRGWCWRYGASPPPLIAHTHFADRNQEDPFLEKHGDDGR